MTDEVAGSHADDECTTEESSRTKMRDKEYNDEKKIENALRLKNDTGEHEWKEDNERHGIHDDN